MAEVGSAHARTVLDVDTHPRVATMMFTHKNCTSKGKLLEREPLSLFVVTPGGAEVRSNQPVDVHINKS